MTEWNFNIKEAPRGKYETQTHERKGKVVTKDVFIPDKIIAAGKCGVVTISHWMPEQGMWHMFGEKESPIAWQLWPLHPRKTP